MPKMVYVKGLGQVRAGSWSTKPVTDQWRLVQKQLHDAAMLMVPRLEHLLFEEGSDYSHAVRELDEQSIIWELEHLHRQVQTLLTRFPKEHRAKALEQVAGRTPQEAALYKAKARKLREAK